jgi:phospholipid/cholesterol/gamma-HCH transport system substrate-binding protein
VDTTLNHEIKVGIFAALGIVLFCVSIILLGGDRFLTSRFQLRVRLPQVQGLGKGSVISLKGVPVGNVEKIAFIKDTSEVEITFGVDPDVHDRITEGSLASVKTQGALGDKYLYIEPGPMTAKPLEKNSLVETDKTPDFLDIIASKGAEMGEIVEVIKEVHKLFANINGEGRSARLMNNLLETTKEVSATMAETRETMKMFRNETLVPMASVMKKLDRGQGTLGALINDSSLHTRITEMLGSSPRNKFLKPLIRESIQTNESKGK